MHCAAHVCSYTDVLLKVGNKKIFVVFCPFVGLFAGWLVRLGFVSMLIMETYIFCAIQVWHVADVQVYNGCYKLEYRFYIIFFFHFNSNI